jgi:hypothetical protein
MAVVVHDSNAAGFAFELEPAIGIFERGKCLGYPLERDVQFQRDRSGG